MSLQYLHHPRITNLVSITLWMSIRMHEAGVPVKSDIERRKPHNCNLGLLGTPCTLAVKDPRISSML